MLSLFPRDVLDDIWYLARSVSEGFPTLSTWPGAPLILPLTVSTLDLYQMIIRFPMHLYLISYSELSFPQVYESETFNNT